MEGLKEALKYAVELSPANTYDYDNGTYTDKELHRIGECIVKPIEATTLESLIDYIQKNIDGLNREDLFINIKSPTEVSLESKYNKDKVRNTYVKCNADIPDINYSEFYENEWFNILMQSSFQSTNDKEIILKVVGNLIEKNITNIGDDGVSQSAAIKTGIANAENVKVPNPVSLKPCRTFIEVQQPESKFVFRMRTGGNCAIFEADGGAWKIQAMKNIREYIEDRLNDIDLDMMIIG